MIKVVILGGGNVAYHLTNEFLKNTSVKLVQVYNRNLINIEYLKNKTSITNRITELKDADIYIIAVSDNAITQLSSKLSLPNKLVVHTSGSSGIKDLYSSSNKGVFYPLQSFSKNSLLNFLEIPICIEAENEDDEMLLEKLAKSISTNCYKINSEQRKYLHMAAVFVNNFVNHLYQLGNEICEENKVPFEILLPIIKETANKIVELSPYEAQTGPAKRNDTKTIEKQQSLLTANKQEIYTLLSKSIYKTYGEKL
ncbi:MAG: DUF2520 domain-containing protein [Lutibacter sp.]|uniref:Rossmann-like and DUF2520 domain-containing protein n=1 Tax=Lutibacter sp. TaxID=1925666 RepID=UPI00184978F8|nr:Rossmann-like and DUF2520 domain-containing protein [Lutibacter sp.]MBT8316020.1 DUF2520 domain-containing protein [Lutibacter sp.]NNJ56880.1 DUF2520 domain-containing protein [Lutibacter sp.]